MYVGQASVEQTTGGNDNDVMEARTDSVASN